MQMDDGALPRPTSKYVNALNTLESRQVYTQKMEKSLTSAQEIWDRRQELANRVQRGSEADAIREKTMKANIKKHKTNLAAANKAKKTAENRFIAMFLEAVEVYLDISADITSENKRQCDPISESLQEFFQRVGKHPGPKKLPELVLGKGINNLCLDHLCRSKAVPSGLKLLIQSSDFLKLVQEKAMITDGGAVDVVGGVLAIDMFKLDENEITKLYTEARDVYIEFAVRWMLDRPVELPDRRVGYETKWSFVPELKEGSDDVKKRYPVRRGYELTYAQKLKLAVAREKQTEKTSLYWTFAYIILRMENGGEKPANDDIVPLEKWEKEGAEAIYKIISGQGNGVDAFFVAPAEGSGSDFRF